jgi:hypothetical protein
MVVQNSSTSLKRFLDRSWHLALVVLLTLTAGQACVSTGPSQHEPAIQTSASPPTWMRGVWTREWIESKGVHSSPLAVHYLQTPSLFADVRFPIDRTAFARATSFADLTDDELLLLAKQNGFTGSVTAVGDTITWHHEIDFQPPDGMGTPDIGRVERLGLARMYEHALDHSYVESWLSVASDNEAYLVVRVERGSRLEQTLLVIGDHFLYVRNRSVDLPVAESLDSLIHNSRASRAHIITYLDCEFSTGRIRAGLVPWEIQASTLPWREGHHLSFADDIAVLPDSTQLRVRVATTDRWTVPVNTLSRNVLIALFPTIK